MNCTWFPGEYLQLVTFPLLPSVLDNTLCVHRAGLCWSFKRRVNEEVNWLTAKHQGEIGNKLITTPNSEVKFSPRSAHVCWRRSGATVCSLGCSPLSLLACCKSLVTVYCWWMPPCTSINHKNLSRNSGPFIFLEKYFPEAPSVSNLFILTFCGGKVGFNVTVCLCVHFLFLLTVATKVWLLAVNPARRHSRSQMSCRS